MKPYFERPGVVLYHADCLEVLPTLAPGRVDAVITDPPYGIGHSSSYGASWQDTQIANDADTFVRDFIAAWASDRSLPWVIFGTWKMAPPKGVRGTLVWDKGPACGMGDLSFPWKGSWEEIYVGGPGWCGRRAEGVIQGHLVLSWESKGRSHPHQKPVSLIRYLLDRLPSGLTVLDAAVGSGTTGVACIQTGRRFIGVEIDERYCEIAAKRLDRAIDEVESEARFFGGEAGAGMV